MHRGNFGFKTRSDGRNKLMHRCITFHAHEYRNLHARGVTHRREVVAQKIDDHQVLGTGFRIVLQPVSRSGVILRIRTARACPFNRLRFGVSVCINHQKTLGRRRKHREIAASQIGGIGRGIVPALSAIQLKKLIWRERMFYPRGTFGTQAHLITIPLVNMPLCALNICAIAFTIRGFKKQMLHVLTQWLIAVMRVITRYLTPRIPRQFAQTRLNFLKPGFVAKQPRTASFMFIDQVPHGGHPERIRGLCRVPGCVSDAPGVQGGARLIPEITHVTTAQTFGQFGNIIGLRHAGKRSIEDIPRCRVCCLTCVFDAQHSRPMRDDAHIRDARHRRFFSCGIKPIGVPSARSDHGVCGLGHDRKVEGAHVQRWVLIGLKNHVSYCRVRCRRS